MIPSSHHGNWRGASRVWWDGPRRDADLTIAVDATHVAYSYRPERMPLQTGAIKLSADTAGVRADWVVGTETAANAMHLQGVLQDGLICLYDVPPEGEVAEWHLQIEIDARDPEYFSIRVFRAAPGEAHLLALDLTCARSGECVVHPARRELWLPP